MCGWGELIVTVEKLIPSTKSQKRLNVLRKVNPFTFSLFHKVGDEILVFFYASMICSSCEFFLVGFLNTRQFGLCYLVSRCMMQHNCLRLISGTKFSNNRFILFSKIKLSRYNKYYYDFSAVFIPHISRRIQIKIIWKRDNNGNGGLISAMYIFCILIL